MKELEYGKVSAMCGKASGQYIEKAVDLALKKEIKKSRTILKEFGSIVTTYYEAWKPLS